MRNRREDEARLKPRYRSIDNRSSMEDCADLATPGCYSLVIALKRRRTIQVGKLGSAEFRRGTYIYTGSALRGLGARLRRHLRQKTTLRWHIDYLLRYADATVEQILLYPAAPGQECLRNQRIGALPGAEISLPGFGASDCKSGCASHLFFFSGGDVSEALQSRTSAEGSLFGSLKLTR